MNTIYLYKGQKDTLKSAADKDRIEEIRQELLKTFDVHNLSFLLGS